MPFAEWKALAEAAERIYEERLRVQLEPLHLHQFVAVEPISGHHYLGRTVSEAIGAARKEHPDRLAHAIRIGHETAVHLGVVCHRVTRDQSYGMAQ